MEAAGGGGGGGCDRLSNLPDCLLHSVLSCLGSRQVVQSSLLSRRWRHLWRAVPCLDIDQREFPLDLPEPEHPGWGAPEANQKAFHDASKKRTERELQLWRIFEDYADSLLPLHAAASSPPALPLDAYRLHVTGVYPHVTCLYRWIRRGLARRPAALHVTNGHGVDTYKHIPRYSLHSHRYQYQADPPVLATRLRRLHLSGFSLPEEFAEELTAAACPVLEDLRLERCDFWFSRIASRSLKSLALEGCSSSCSYDGTALALAVPRLVSLSLGDVQPPVVSEDEMPSLAVASITATHDAYAGGVVVLKSLRAARVLALRSFNSAELFDEEPKEFLKFENLRTLTLTKCEIRDECQVLRHLLHNVPNLERLVLDDCKLSSSSTKASDFSYRSYGCTSLKSIEIKYAAPGAALPDVLVRVLKDISKNTSEWRRCGQKGRVDWEWLYRVVSCSPVTMITALVAQRAPAALPDDDFDSMSEEEHESAVWKRRARRRRAVDTAIKACRGARRRR